ncbi:MAG: DUF368 domain-containing protein [Clostridiales bacterium]|nr:DUF368 domain-containing protein [Clostridiales bacterium]
MEENEKEVQGEPSQPEPADDKKKHSGAVNFLTDILRGVGIGVAFIIPGFSGGSVAAILGVYERLVNAIADIFKQFKKSILTLLPIAIGMLLGIAALILPIQWGLKNYPIPTVMLFVGLALGGLPSITDKMKGAKLNWKYVLACSVPLLAAAALCFLPLAGDVDLFHLSVGGYFLLVLIGIVGSCALVVPGISGSMLLLIFGYYNPVVALVTNHLLRGADVGVSIGVLACLAVGVVAGFFAISILMKYLLKKFPRGTYYSILGFIVGSIPAVFVSTVRGSAPELAGLYSSAWYWVVAVILLAIGFALSFLLVWYAKKKEKKTIENPPA